MPRLLARLLLLPPALLLASAPHADEQRTLNALKPDSFLAGFRQVFFSIQAKAEPVSVCALTLDTIALFIDTGNSEEGHQAFPVNFQVYEGPSNAPNNDMSAWTLIGSKISTSLEESFYLECQSSTIPEGDERRFAVFAEPVGSQGSAPTLTVFVPPFVDVVQNDDISVVSGEGTFDPEPFSGTNSNGQFVGIVHYNVGTGLCSESELEVVILPPTLFDGPEPGGVGPLVSGKSYVVAPGTFGWAEIPAGKTLTAEPGTTVFLGDGTSVASRINVHGKTSWEDTTVTSVYDDTVGGDTDGQLGLTPRAPAPGDFEGVDYRFTTDDSLWDGGQLRYGGSNASLAALDIDDGGVTVRNVVFRDNAAGIGFTLSADNSGEPVVTDNLFYQNESPPIGRVSLDMLEGFSSNVAAENLGGDFLTVSGSTIGCSGAPFAKITKDVEISAGDYPGDVLVLDGGVCVTDGASLSLAPGTTIKFDPNSGGGIEVRDSGTLLIDGSGSQPVTFSSLGNDSVVGDTDKNGMSTSQPGDWRGIRVLQGGLGSAKHAKVLDAGSLQPAIDLQSSGFSADSLIVFDSGSDGIVFSSLDGDLTNSMVKGSARDGFVLSPNDPDGSDPSLLSGTSLGNARDGVRSTGASIGGKIVNTIAWDNAGDNFGVGILSSDVESSLGGFAGINGNLDQDPLLDANGTPTAVSPVLAAGDPASTPFNTDLRDNSRFKGFVATQDMGAIESSNVTLTGEAFQVGSTVKLTTQSTAFPGAPVVYLAGNPIEVFLPGFGLLGVDLSSYVLVGVGLTGESVDMVIPDLDSGGAGLVNNTFAVQGFVAATPPGTIQPTNVHLSEVYIDSDSIVDVQ